MQIVRKLDMDAWRDFVMQNPRANIFHSPEMYQAFERTRGSGDHHGFAAPAGFKDRIHHLEHSPPIPEVDRRLLAGADRFNKIVQLDAVHVVSGIHVRLRVKKSRLPVRFQGGAGHGNFIVQKAAGL